jgi:hypothetical protein
MDDKGDENMKLTDIKTLQQVSRDYNIPWQTLQTRLESKNIGMIEGVDYIKLGQRQPTILSPSGIYKITLGGD